jgi:hypothetical protein
MTTLPANPAAQQQVNNAQFMEVTFNQPIPMLVQGSANYVPGNVVSFKIPSMPGAYADKITIGYNLNVQYTAATAAPVIALNAAAPWSVISNVNIKLGNPQIFAPPYVLRQFEKMRGYRRTDLNQPIGNINADVQALLYTAPTVNVGANNWIGQIDVSLNALHRQTPYGMLPCVEGTPITVDLQLPAPFAGPDPLNNVLTTNGVVVATGTISINIWYRDQHTLIGPVPQLDVNGQPLLDGSGKALLSTPALDLSALPTVQIIKINEINPLTAGNLMFQKIEQPYQVPKVVNIIVDGQQSNKFVSNVTNVQEYDLLYGATPSASLFKFNASTGGMNNYYLENRRLYDQDFDSGVYVLDTASLNQQDVDSQGGTSYLDLRSGKYPAASFAYQVGAVSTANQITPRVSSWAMIINEKGITNV